MTKIRLVSDLHLEFGNLDLRAVGEDVLAIAGDVGIYCDGIDWADDISRQLNIPVVMIAGNHEFYQNRQHRGHTICGTLDALHEKAAATRGRVTFLERETAVISGVRFIGTTLWTDFNLFGNAPAAQWAARERMNDYRLISFSQTEEFRPEIAAREHALSLAFIAGELHKPFAGQTVVMTHHAPSRRSVAGRYASDDLSPAYASNLDALVERSGAAIWQHGHVHHSFDYMIGETRIRTNPRGYDGYELNPEFDAALVVELAAQGIEASGEDAQAASSRSDESPARAAGAP